MRGKVIQPPKIEDTVVLKIIFRYFTLIEIIFVVQSNHTLKFIFGNLGRYDFWRLLKIGQRKNNIFPISAMEFGVNNTTFGDRDLISCRNLFSIARCATVKWPTNCWKWLVAGHVWGKTPCQSQFRGPVKGKTMTFPRRFILIFVPSNAATLSPLLWLMKCILSCRKW